MKVLDINVKAAYIVSQEFGRKMLELERPGKIIHIASMASYIAQEDISVYASSKSFVRNMTRALSNEWASKGIQCNCISPGYGHYRSQSFFHLLIDPTDSSRPQCPSTCTMILRSTNMSSEGLPPDAGVIRTT
jgi:NAD(P)-dependent dehydrogenase (short-subunit alcohol dehydrogenase family)